MKKHVDMTSGEWNGMYWVDVCASCVHNSVNHNSEDEAPENFRCNRTIFYRCWKDGKRPTLYKKKRS